MRGTVANRLMLQIMTMMLGAVLAGGASKAQAADFEDYGRDAPRGGYYEPRGPVYARPGYPPPVVERRVEVDEGYCRVFHRRRVDPDGREVVHRVRVCDEGIVPPARAWAEGPRSYGHEPRYDAPRPPRAVGRPYEEGWE